MELKLIKIIIFSKKYTKEKDWIYKERLEILYLEKFITPNEFDDYKKMAYAKGFLMAACSPLTRSSYHASDDFKIMQENRKNKLYSIQ